MNKEQQPLLYEQLLQRHDQLQDRLQRKEYLRHEEIPNKFKKVNPDDFKTSIKLGKANARLDKDIHEIQNSLTHKEEEITTWMTRHGQELMSKAQVYIDEVTLKRNQLGEMEGLATAGYLPQDVLEQHRGRFRILAGIPGIDPALKMGIALLQRHKEQAAPVESTPPELETSPFPEIPEFTRLEQKAYEIIRAQHPIASSIWTEGLWGDQVDVRVRRDRLTGALMRRLREKLHKHDLSVVNVAPGQGKQPGSEAVYDLVRTAEPKTPTLESEEENKTLTINGKTINLTERFMLFIKPLISGGLVSISSLDQILKAHNIKSRAAIVKADLERAVDRKFIETVGSQKEGFAYRLIRQSPVIEEVEEELDREKLQAELDELRARRERIELQTQTLVDGQPLIDPALLLPIEEKIRELENLLGVKPSELDEIELKPEDIVETTVDRAAQYVEDVDVVLYEPSEEEVRSMEETKILTYVATMIDTNQKVSFEALQRELFSDKRVGRAPGGGRRLFIYQAKELKDMFDSALRKIREEAVIPSLKEGWSDQDQQLWADLTQAAHRLSGSDMSDFIRKIRLEIDRAEREFYRNSPPPENGGNKVHYIRL